MTTLKEILSALGILVDLDNLYEFDRENLLKEGFKQLSENIFRNQLTHKIFENIVIKKDQNEVDVLLSGSRLTDSQKKIDFLKQLYSLFSKDLNLTEFDLDNYQRDYNDVLEDINFSIGIHHEMINCNIRITLKNKDKTKDPTFKD